jgi:hypothetical protein
MRVSIGDVSLFFEVLGREWVVDDAVQRRRPVVVGIHGGPGSNGMLLRHQLARGHRRRNDLVHVSAWDTSGARHRDISSTGRHDLRSGCVRAGHVRCQAP